MKKFLHILFVIFTFSAIAYSQNVDQSLNEAAEAAADGSYQVTITMANGSRDIIELSEEMLKEISLLRKSEEDYVFNLTPTVIVNVFSYSKIKDEAFQAPEIYVFVD